MSDPLHDAPAARARSPLQRLSTRLVRWLDGLSSALLFLMMSLMVVDVVGRKFFNRPLVGAVELVELCLLVSVYGAIPLVSASRQHIRIELLDAVVPPSLAALRERVSELLCGLLLVACAWLAAGRTIVTLHAEDASTLLRIALWPFYAGVALLLAVDALVHLSAAFQRRAGNAA